MAAGQNPLAGMIMGALQNRGGAGGGMPGMPPPGGMPGMPGQGGGAEPAATDYASQVAELKGADPGMLLRQIKAMKQIAAVLMVQNLERLPNVAGQVSKLIPMFDRIIKEIQQASNTAQAVRNPIGMGAAQTPPGGDAMSQGTMPNMTM